jgi:hypothetical protein
MYITLRTNFAIERPEEVSGYYRSLGHCLGAEDPHGVCHPAVHYKPGHQKVLSVHILYPDQLSLSEWSETGLFYLPLG